MSQKKIPFSMLAIIVLGLVFGVLLFNFLTAGQVQVVKFNQNIAKGSVIDPQFMITETTVSEKDYTSATIASFQSLYNLVMNGYSDNGVMKRIQDNMLLPNHQQIIARTDISADVPVRAEQVSWKQEPILKIDDDKAIFRIPIDAISATSEQLRDGDYVDVYQTSIDSVTNKKQVKLQFQKLQLYKVYKSGESISSVIIIAKKEEIPKLILYLDVLRSGMPYRFVISGSAPCPTGKETECTIALEPSENRSNDPTPASK